jgi:hypothetical protein
MEVLSGIRLYRDSFLFLTQTLSGQALLVYPPHEAPLLRGSELVDGLAGRREPRAAPITRLVVGNVISLDIILVGIDEAMGHVDRRAVRDKEKLTENNADINETGLEKRCQGKR